MKRVLAIDDSPVILSLIKDVLSINNYQIETADNGREGIEKYRKFRPDVVTLDLAMPGMDGRETLMALKEIDEDANVLMLTAADNSLVITECLEKGAAGVVLKPFKPNDLLTAIGKVTKTGQP